MNLQKKSLPRSKGSVPRAHIAIIASVLAAVLLAGTWLYIDSQTSNGRHRAYQPVSRVGRHMRPAVRRLACVGLGATPPRDKETAVIHGTEEN